MTRKAACFLHAIVVPIAFVLQQSNQIQLRRDALTRVARAGGFHTSATAGLMKHRPGFWIASARELFGDKRVYSLGLDPSMAGELEKMEALFPEADIGVIVDEPN